MELCLYEMYLIYLIFDNGLFKAKLKCGVGGGLLCKYKTWSCIFSDYSAAVQAYQHFLLILCDLFV